MTLNGGTFESEAEPDLGTQEHLARWPALDPIQPSQKNINLGTLADVAVPIPPLEEQAEIVRRAKVAFELVASAEAHIDEAVQGSLQLPHAALAAEITA